MQKFEQFTLIEDWITSLFKDCNTFCIKDSSDSRGQLYQRKYWYRKHGVVEIFDELIPLNYQIEQINSKSKMVTIIYTPLELPLTDIKSINAALKHYKRKYKPQLA